MLQWEGINQTPCGTRVSARERLRRPCVLSKERCFVYFDKIVCWEPTSVNDPMIPAAGRLYEETLAPNERIPWDWIEQSVGQEIKSGSWIRHLILAAPEGQTDNPASLAGY